MAKAGLKTNPAARIERKSFFACAKFNLMEMVCKKD